MDNAILSRPSRTGLKGATSELRVAATCALLLLAMLGLEASAQSSALTQARRLFTAGSYEEAARVLEPEIAAHPDDADAHLLLGQIDAIQGRRGDAIAELSRAAELEPQSATVYEVLGTALSRFAEFDSARQAFEQAVALDPKLVEAHINLAMLLAEGGDMKGAAAQLTTAIALHPAAPSAARAYYLLAKINRDGDPSDAMDELAKAVKLDPHDEKAWLDFGSMKSDAGDGAGALAAYEHAVACAPKDPEAQYELGSQYLRQGKAPAAAEHLELARKLTPQPTISLLYKLDRALRKVGRIQEADVVKAQVMALLAQDADANAHSMQAQELERDALALQDQGDLKAAARKFEQALELNPTQSQYRYNYALALCHLGRWPEGIDELNEVLEDDPGNIDARRALFIAKDKARHAVD